MPAIFPGSHNILFLCILFHLSIRYMTKPFCVSKQTTIVQILILLFFLPIGLAAQRPGAAPGTNAAMNTGRFYGKVIDDASGKGLAYASVQLLGMQWDSSSRSMKPGIIAGQLTRENGEFSLENLPVMGEMTLKIIFLGYGSLEQKVAFPKPTPGSPRSGGAPVFEKDLGNLRLKMDAKLLQEVEVKGEASQVSLALDKKVYRVDKDNIAAGGTAEDALRNIPSLNVDLDGNLTLRNAAPQVFVDGRPTLLSIDQIPADAIENVEIITNPSAKFDASGGGAGIVNIVLKKNRRVGYNGSLRGGVDARPRMNLGGDINVRQGKINAFIGGNFNQRRNLTEGSTERENLFYQPLTRVLQENDGVNEGYFASGRGGVDWFLNNRNTLTLGLNYHGGSWDNEDKISILTDSVGAGSSLANRLSNAQRRFGNLGTQLLFKHLFPKEGKEWTADLNYNNARFDNEGLFNTVYQGSVFQTRQRQNGDGFNEFMTAQTDFVTPLGNGTKMEIGARGAIRNYDSENYNYLYDFTTELFKSVPSGFADKYRFRDEVYAAYSTFSKSWKKFGYQLGLRVESSRYTGTLVDSGQKFSNNFPLSAFPSAFLTYRATESRIFQFNYSRRVQRPSFFQLIPFPDFSDSLLLSRGNPDLIPEFTNTVELSYQHIFNKGHNLLVSGYVKRSDNLITRYQFSEYDDNLKRQIIVSSFENSNFSTAYGLELTLKNSLFEKLDLTTNANFYNAIIDAQNVENALRTEQFSFFIKENLSLKLPKQLTFQANASYVSRTAFDNNSSSGGFGGGRGGGGGFGGTSNTAQGYTIPVWFCDLSLRKDFWKRTASLTFSVQDVFRSRKTGSHAESAFFIQDSWRRRDPQLAKINFSWRFGKYDVSLFRRKNTRMEEGGMDF